MDMNETSIITHVLSDVLPTAGLGGVLALVMFHFYRTDANRNMDRFDEIMRRQEAAALQWLRIVQENTEALVRLAERLKS